MNKKGLFGFTLAELLIVISIITILVTLGFNFYSGYLKRGRDSKRKAQIERIRTALEEYRADHPIEGYPANTGLLVTSADIPPRQYLRNSDLADPIPSLYVLRYYRENEVTYYYGAFLEGGNTDSATICTNVLPAAVTLDCSAGGAVFICSYCVRSP